MAATRDTRADDLFRAALARPHSERRPFLADACRDNPELTAEVERLLAEHDEAGGYFEGVAGEIASTTEPELNAREPLRGGPNQTLRVIGRQQAISNLGLLMMAESRPADAEALFRQALDSLRASLGPDHPLVATGLHNLGTARLAQRDPEGAATCFESALAIRRKALPPGHPDTTLTIGKLVETYDLLGDKDKADAYRRTLAGR